MKTFETNPARGAAVAPLLTSLSRRPHYGLDDSQREFVTHCLRYYGHGRNLGQQGPLTISIDKIGCYPSEYILKTLKLCRANLNSHGETVLNQCAWKIEVPQEIIWACTGAGELPVVDPICLTMHGRVRIHAIVRAIKEYADGEYTGEATKWLADWACRYFEKPLVIESLRFALQHAELFGPDATGNGFTAFPDAAPEIYWPALQATNWTAE